MQAIKTVYKGPTNSRGSRIIASCDAKRATYAWDYRLGVEDNHVKAAQRHAEVLGWAEVTHGKLVSGSLAGDGYAHVFVKGSR
jgi:hypothetical protein